jgi:hypothetical protein
MRLPEDLLVRIDARAEAESVTRTAMIVNSLWDVMIRPANPRATPTSSKARQIATQVPSMVPASSLPTPSSARYERPAHASTCKCGICMSR